MPSSWLLLLLTLAMRSNWLGKLLPLTAAKPRPLEAVLLFCTACRASWPVLRWEDWLKGRKPKGGVSELLSGSISEVLLLFGEDRLLAPASLLMRISLSISACMPSYSCLHARDGLMGCTSQSSGSLTGWRMRCFS